MASLGTFIAQFLGFALALAEAAYLLLALLAVFRYRPPAAAPAATRPGISLLVPAHGDFPGFEACLRSICAQDYPRFEVIFGLHSADDAARPVIERVMRDFPGVVTKLVVDERRVGANPKNCNLANIYPSAAYDILAMVDADIRVRPDFLAVMADELEGEGIGAVTCLYTAAAAPGLPSALGALSINDWFVPSGLVDVMLRQEHMCYGAAITMRRRTLEELGGFEAMGSAVAQDYVLGQRLREAGYRIRLSRATVETVVAEPNLPKLLRREQRWNRAVRACRPVDHALSVVTHALPLAAALLLAGGTGAWGAAAVGVIVALRLALHHLVRRRLPVGGAAQQLLVLARECLSLAVWVSAFTTAKMRWGDHVLIAVDKTSMVAREG